MSGRDREGYVHADAVSQSTTLTRLVFARRLLPTTREPSSVHAARDADRARAGSI